MVGESGRVVIECAPKLLPLFRRSFGWAEVVGKSDPPDERCMKGVDVQIAAGSLGRYLRPGLESFPQRVETDGAYLFADGKREMFWRTKLAELGPGLKVGVSWRSTVLKGERALQCTKLMQWGEVFKVAGEVASN